MASILVLGATGYIGGRLVPRLLSRGHRVRCLVRSPEKISGRNWDGVEILAGDVLHPETFGAAFERVDLVFYLIHSMTSGADEFETRDRLAAENVALAARRAGVRRIVYLGGLGKKDGKQSAHLSSRHEVGSILRDSGVPVTEFRAAVIIGSGSASFEMMHHLVNRLPLMICPRWVSVKTQPIGIDDVLRYLTESVENQESSGKVLDIGAPEVLTYREMMIAMSRALRLKRHILPVPVLTPRLSSYWVNLITPIPTSLARALIESLRHETVCENQDALRLFTFIPTPFEECLRKALEKTQAGELETKWTAASAPAAESHIDPSHLMTEVREVDVRASHKALFHVVCSLGGENGWLYGNWLWKLRGFLDKQLGGVGLRRGRRHATQIAIGEALDFWRVEDIQPDSRLLLRAEMKVWGQAWLEYEIENLGNERSRLRQTARYYPKGLKGLLYWFTLYPLHRVVFRGLARAIAQKAERMETQSINEQPVSETPDPAQDSRFVDNGKQQGSQEGEGSGLNG